MVCCSQLWENSIQHLKLPRRAVQVGTTPTPRHKNKEISLSSSLEGKECRSFQRTPALFRQRIPDVRRRIPAQTTQNERETGLKRKKKKKKKKQPFPSRSYLYLLEHVRMVADLPQLHDGVHQSLCASFSLETHGYYCWNLTLCPEKKKKKSTIQKSPLFLR